MSITMNGPAGRKGKRGPTSPSSTLHSPPTTALSLPKIKLNIRPNPNSRASSSSRSGSRGGSSTQRRNNVFNDDSSSDLTPAEEDEDDEQQDDEDDDDDDDVFPSIPLSRKGKKRESLVSPSTAKDKGKGKATTTTPTSTKKPQERGSTPRPTAEGPNGRERKRLIKLGEVARRRARDDKFGFGGDRFGAVTPTQAHVSNPIVDSDSTSSYGDDESERENAVSLYNDETDDEESMGSLHEAFAGQEIEDLAYGAGYPDAGMDDTEPEGWQEEEDDEDLIAQLSGSDIDGMQSQSSVHMSDSDDPMSDSTSSTESGDDTLDEFGYPIPFATQQQAPVADAPLILMENWDGQFVLVQTRHERSRSRHRGDRSSRTAGSVTAGSVGESTSLSASEQQLVIDADANVFSDTDSDWSAGDGDDDGGDTTDSMAEEDMPVLDSPALDELIGQQLSTGYGGVISTFPLEVPPLDSQPPALVVTDMADLPDTFENVFESTFENALEHAFETPALSTASSVSAAATPDIQGLACASTTSTPPVVLPPGTPLPVPVMGTFVVGEEPCAHAVIDGSKTTTKSPFTRRRRSKTSDTASVTSTKRRSRLDSFSPIATKKQRYSSIPGHPRYIAARRAAGSLVDPLDRETTPSDDEPAFSLDDMLDASMLHVGDNGTSESAEGDELRHLFRFDKVPVSMYMRRNFGRRDSQPTTYGGFSSPASKVVDRATLADTLAGPMAHPASRMLISPLLQPTGQSEHDEPLSRKERRRMRKMGEMRPLQI